MEVKARLSDEFGLPSEAVDIRKQRKISMVASQYIKKNMLFGAPVRFDVIEVYLETESINHITHLKVISDTDTFLAAEAYIKCYGGETYRYRCNQT